MSANITHILDLDLYTYTSYPVIKAQQYDDQTRYMRVRLKDHEEDFNISQGAVVTFRGQRAEDGNSHGRTFEIQAYEVESRSPAIIVFDITQAITRAGTATGKIVISDGTTQLSSIPIFIDIEPDVAAQASASEDEKDIIRQLTEELRGHESNIVMHLTEQEHQRITNLKNIVYSSNEPSGQQKDDIWLQEY